MGVVAGQQLLNPARDKARHRGDIRDGVTPREQPDHLNVPRRGRILGPTGASLPDPRRSDDQQPAPWPASATHGPPAYPLRDRTGIQAESFVRNPYHTAAPMK